MTPIKYTAGWNKRIILITNKKIPIIVIQNMITAKKNKNLKIPSIYFEIN